MGAAREYWIRADRVASRAPPRDHPRRRGAHRRERRRARVELWTAMHGVRAADLRRRLRASTGTWPRVATLAIRAWLRCREAAALAPYRAVARWLDADLARLDGTGAPAGDR